MPLACPKCGRYEVVELQAACPGGCDLSDCWPLSGAAVPEPETDFETAAAAGIREGEAPAEPHAADDPRLGGSLTLPGAAGEAGMEPVPTAEAAAAEATLPSEAEIPVALPVSELLCPGCQAAVDPVMRFCDCCGWPLVPHCPDCGTENRSGARFCGSCGGRLVTKPERRGRTRFCPTCGHELARRTTERRTDTVTAEAASPRLPQLETPVPVAVPEAEAEPVSLEGEGEAPAEPAGVPEVAARHAPRPPEPAVAEVPPEQPVAEPLPAPAFELLVVKADGTPLAAFPLKEGDNLVGVRTAGATHTLAVDLAPFDNRKVISRRHALVRVTGNRLLLADCGSTNGTTVNEQALTKTLVEVTEEAAISFAGLRCRIQGK